MNHEAHHSKHKDTHESIDRIRFRIEPSRSFPREQNLSQGTQPVGARRRAKYFERARGSHVWDVDGNEYIDLTMAIGPVSLGYAYPAVDDAIRAQLKDGITFTLMHPLEVEVAELLSHAIPGAEMVRFSKTGCDITSAAIRLARAFTGRPHVLCCGYHGWHDWYVAGHGSSAGGSGCGQSAHAHIRV